MHFVCRQLKAEDVSCDHKEHHANRMELSKRRATHCWKGQPCRVEERAVAPPRADSTGRMSVEGEELLENEDCNEITNMLPNAKRRSRRRLLRIHKTASTRWYIHFLAKVEYKRARAQVSL